MVEVLQQSGRGLGNVTGFDVIAYTDGGCRMKGERPGGWAFVLIHAKSRRALARAGAEWRTTVNRMELMAAIEALKAVRRTPSILLRSDSKQVIDGCTGWYDEWRARGWKRKSGRIANLELVQELDALNRRLHPRFAHVPAHSGEPGNEFVDNLLNDAMDRLVAGEDPSYQRRFRWVEELPGIRLGKG